MSTVSGAGILACGKAWEIATFGAGLYRNHWNGGHGGFLAGSTSWRIAKFRMPPVRRRRDQPQFQTGPIGVRVQQGPKLPPL